MRWVNHCLWTVRLGILFVLIAVPFGAAGLLAANPGPVTGPASSWPQMPSEIQWQSLTDTTIFRPSSGGSWYPRLLKMSKGHWLCAFDTNAFASSAEVWVSRSLDGGKSWTLLSKASFGTGAAANGQLTELPNGDILCTYRLINEPDKTLKVSRSQDQGQTWQHLSTIISDPEGVWEPHILRKPDGQLLVFYARETAGNNYQLVELQRSDDNGATWHRPQAVSAGPQSRDGMPVPALLNNGQIMVVFEGWIEPANPRMVLGWVRSSDGGDSWTPRRALYIPDDPAFQAAAPFLVQMPTGELVVSFQTELNTNSREMKVLVSADDGKSWSLQNDPFGSTASWWNCLMVESPDTLAAATSSAGKIRMIKGLLTGPGDLNADGAVGLADLAQFAARWLDACEASNHWCDGADCSRDGIVDYEDLSLLGWFWAGGLP